MTRPRWSSSACMMSGCTTGGGCTLPYMNVPLVGGYALHERMLRACPVRELECLPTGGATRGWMYYSLLDVLLFNEQHLCGCTTAFWMFRRELSQRLVQSGDLGFAYNVDLSSMKQTNSSTHTVRNIRRMLTDFPGGKASPYTAVGTACCCCCCCCWCLPLG